jgi:hypothetical protein
MRSWFRTGARVTGAAVLLFVAMPEASAQQCIPAVANPTAYERCHLRQVRGQEVCRCALVPAGRLSQGKGSATVAWGSLTSRPSDWATNGLVVGSYSPSSRTSQTFYTGPSEGPAGSGESVQGPAAATGTTTQTADAQSTSATVTASNSREVGSTVPGLGIAGPNGSIHSDPIPAPANP